MTTNISADVIIVGGGPAGSSCARELVQGGADCLVLEAEEFPRPKPCAGWITPRVLSDLRITPADYPGGIVPLDTIHLHIHGVHIPLPTRQYSIRRIEFDEWLLRRSGARVVRHRVRRVERRGHGFIMDDRFRGRVLVGAGGTGCPVRKAFFPGLDARPRDSLVSAVEAEFPSRHAEADCHLWFFDQGVDGYSWIVPKAGGLVNVGIGGMATSLSGRSIRSCWEPLMQRMRRLGILEGDSPRPVGACYYLRRRDMPFRSGEVYLAGDAAGLATVDLGEGIGAAIQSGIAVARAILDGAAYPPPDLPVRSLPSMVVAGLRRLLGLR